jgi:hypothetical protein
LNTYMVSQQPNTQLQLLFRPKMNFNNTWGPILWKKHFSLLLTAPPCIEGPPGPGVGIFQLQVVWSMALTI